MITFNLALVAQSHTIDPQSHLISITNVLEVINYDGLFPTSMPESILFLLWERGDEPLDQQVTAQFQVRLESPIGDDTPILLTQQPLEARIQPGEYKSKGIIPLAGMPIKAAGVNRIVITQNQSDEWIEVGEVTFKVTGS